MKMLQQALSDIMIDTLSYQARINFLLEMIQKDR
jgi:hypothetical protein